MLEYRGKIPYLLNDIQENIVYLCSSNKNIIDYGSVLKDIYSGDVLEFESSNDTEEKEKINYDFLKLLRKSKKNIMLISLEAYLRDYFLEGEKLVFKVGQIIDIKKLEEDLIKNGYEKVYMVEDRNEYSIRGDIIDIFSKSQDNPIRMELGFDDEIERLVFFDKESQRTIEKQNEIIMYMDNNKSKKVSFISLLKDVDSRKFFIENIDLLKYKLEEIILRNRDNEEIFRKRYKVLKERAKEIEITGFTQEEINKFEDNDYIKKLAHDSKINIEIMSDEAKRYENIFKDYKNIKCINYPLFEGFRDKDKLVLTDRELKGIRVKREVREKPKLRYKNPTEMKPGDYIIHENYGVGIYLGIEIIADREYLAIRYADEDKLYVPIEGINRIEKYISPDGVVPQIYNLGRRGFKKKKEKLYEDMVKFAREILELQAKREDGNGYRYTGDTIWQEEFEESFPYTETPAQKNAIDDVKQDMESYKVMDRVICGDVGYGKTEVAMRAAFKAAIDGKQVAIMVPTTVLAQQHYKNFVERMKNYPITIELLSRLKTKKEQEIALNKISSGSIDIVIGTHRLLSKDVKFKDLGLVIIDEEQKFGVKAKENIKKYRSNVDLLTLTATPIPRTLNLSLLGIRDLSIVDTPPVGRKVPITEFINDDIHVLKDIIMKEISREGQIFYIYNFVEGIKNKVRELEEFLPHYIKIDYVHGRLSPKEIKEKIESFDNGDIDILVATTIIENGIDIENANTMIIDGVDKLGLSQIYQLRGRIGRGHRQSYCYLLQKEYKSKKAQARENSLKLLEEEGGGGLELSMEDMKIRGAGEILGERQHGALETFGYNLYMKMLKEEIDKLKNSYTENKNLSDIEIPLNYKAYIPDEYIDKNQKIKVYRDLVEINNLKDLEDYRLEILDIYGKMPNEVIGLFRYIKNKIKSKDIGIVKVLEINDDIIEIKFDKKIVNVDVIFKMLEENVITYDNKKESIKYIGNLDKFLDVFDEISKEVKK